MANVLLEFACNQTSHHNDASKNVFIINKALTLYLQGKQEESKKIISTKDWSASSDDFKLAYYVISEKNDDCYKLMKKIGSDGEVDKENYRNWPLFLKLRKEDRFKKVFKDIFKEDYKTLEIPKTPAQELINDLVKDNPEIKSKTVKKKLSKKQKESKKSNKI